MGRHRRHSRPSHLCSPSVQWGDVPKMKHDKPMRAGDWSCPDCGANNYARRQKCYNCDTAPVYKRRCGFDANTKIECFDAKPGDWQCRVCGNLCYARRRKCFHCLEPRGSVESIIPFSHELLWPGDWLCPICGYHNYKGRARCHCCLHRK